MPATSSTCIMNAHLLYDVASNILPGPSSRVVGLHVLEEDQHVVSASRDRTIITWDLIRERRISSHQQHGRAMPVDPIKPMLKGPVSMGLILKSDKPLSIFAFKCNMRRYSTAASGPRWSRSHPT
jgi:WD40 repeat protein